MREEIEIESLVSTMNSDVEMLVEKMKIRTAAIVVNQQDRVYSHHFTHKNYPIREFSFAERGIGLSRNTALMRSQADVCLMADDDMVYVDHYQEIVQKAFAKHPQADMLIFNVRIHTNGRIEEKVKKNGKVHYLNSLKYGTVTFAFKREVVIKNNIYFSLLFGGGAKYSNGEDSLFLWDCLRNGMTIMTVTDVIADVYNDDSTWFTGYNQKFFEDRGALFAALSPVFSRLLVLQFAWRKKNLYQEQLSFSQCLKWMENGRKKYLGK